MTTYDATGRPASRARRDDALTLIAASGMGIGIVGAVALGFGIGASLDIAVPMPVPRSSPIREAKTTSIPHDPPRALARTLSVLTPGSEPAVYRISHLEPSHWTPAIDFTCVKSSLPETRPPLDPTDLLTLLIPTATLRRTVSIASQSEAVSPWRGEGRHPTDVALPDAGLDVVARDKALCNGERSWLPEHPGSVTSR